MKHFIALQVSHCFKGMAGILLLPAAYLYLPSAGHAFLHLWSKRRGRGGAGTCRCLMRNLCLFFVAQLKTESNLNGSKIKMPSLYGGQRRRDTEEKQRCEKLRRDWGRNRSAGKASVKAGRQYRIELVWICSRRLMHWGMTATEILVWLASEERASLPFVLVEYMKCTSTSAWNHDKDSKLFQEAELTRDSDWFDSCISVREADMQMNLCQRCPKKLRVVAACFSKMVHVWRVLCSLLLFRFVIQVFCGMVLLWQVGVDEMLWDDMHKNEPRLSILSVHTAVHWGFLGWIHYDSFPRP